MKPEIKASAIGKRGFWILVVGTILNTLALASWTLSAPLEASGTTHVWATVAAVLLHTAAVAFIVAATLAGIITLAKKARPIVWPLLATLSLPITFVVLTIQLVIMRSLFDV